MLPQSTFKFNEQQKQWILKIKTDSITKGFSEVTVYVL